MSIVCCVAPIVIVIRCMFVIVRARLFHVVV